MIRTVKGRRIKLREHSINDMTAYLHWQCDERVGTHLSWLPRTEQEAKQSLLDAINEQSNPNRQRFFMAIVRTSDEEIVGEIGLTKSSPNEADIGWFLRPGFEGNGYAVEGAALMVGISFEVLGLSTLRASCRRENTRSERIMKKLYFRLERSIDERLFYTLDAKGWMATQS